MVRARFGLANTPRCSQCQTLIELDSGSAVVRTGAPKADTTMVRLGAGTITLRNAGIYRIDAAPARLRVIRGAGTVEIARDRWSVASGRELSLTGAPSLARFDLRASLAPRCRAPSAG
jgi:hypothetical protein